MMHLALGSWRPDERCRINIRDLFHARDDDNDDNDDDDDDDDKLISLSVCVVFFVSMFSSLCSIPRNIST